MMYKKVVINGYILGVGQVEHNGNITEDEYNELTALFHDMPNAPDGYEAKLNDNTLEWDIIEIPPEPEPELTDSEALNILLGGDVE